MFTIREDDLADARVVALLELHLAAMREHSPPGSVHALDLSRLRAAEVTVWTVWEDQRIAGIGALKLLGSGAAEVKSMRTHPDFVRRGVAALLLETIIAKAQDSGVSRLSLETGSGRAFDPALALYRRRGFVAGEAFGGYAPTAFNQIFHLALTR